MSSYKKDDPSKTPFTDVANEVIAKATGEMIEEIDSQIAAAGRQLAALRKMRAAIVSEDVRPGYHSPEHMAAALTWIEQNAPGGIGISLVAAALSETGK